MRLEELYEESFDSKVDFDVTTHSADKYQVESTIKGRKLKVVASKVPSESDSWDFEFFELTKNGKWTTAKTGSGGEMQVYALVKTVLEEFISIYHPETIEMNSFEEDGSARGRLYERFLRRLKLDYDLEVFKSHSTGQATFTLKKKS